jgi:hypothetical protein
VLLKRSAARLDVEIPPAGFGPATVATGGFALVWNAFVATWTVSALAGGGILFAAFSIPFWLAGGALVRSTFASALLRERFAVGRERFKLTQELASIQDGLAKFLGGAKSADGAAGDLTGARIVTSLVVNDEPRTAIEIAAGLTKFKFGEGLDASEQAWIVHQINAFIASQSGGGGGDESMDET